MTLVLNFFPVLYEALPFLPRDMALLKAFFMKAFQMAKIETQQNPKQ